MGELRSSPLILSMCAWLVLERGGRTDPVGDLALDFPAATCRAIGGWWLHASAKCKTAGLGLLYFEIADLCGSGGYAAKYTCCPPGVSTQVVAPSSPGCPPTPTSWQVGAPCTPPLHCNYPDPCGTVIDWHCKGGWMPNSGCLCSKASDTDAGW